MKVQGESSGGAATLMQLERHASLLGVLPLADWAQLTGAGLSSAV